MNGTILDHQCYKHDQRDKDIDVIEIAHKLAFLCCDSPVAFCRPFSAMHIINYRFIMYLIVIGHNINFQLQHLVRFQNCSSLIFGIQRFEHFVGPHLSKYTLIFIERFKLSMAEYVVSFTTGRMTCSPRHIV